MKRYLVFKYAAYYPSGGWNDFQNDFAELSDAREYAAAAQESFYDVDIVDTDTGEIVGQEAEILRADKVQSRTKS